MIVGLRDTKIVCYVLRVAAIALWEGLDQFLVSVKTIIIKNEECIFKKKIFFGPSWELCEKSGAGSDCLICRRTVLFWGPAVFPPNISAGSLIL